MRWLILALVVLAGLPLRAQEPPRVTIGSKNFTENRLLAEAMAQLIERETDIEVVRRINLGGTMVVASALLSGEIDIYPEYTGTAWAIHLGIKEKISDPLRAYLHVEKEYRRRHDLEWLQPFGFENSYALAVLEERAEELDLQRISDLLPHMKELRAAMSHEFLDRQDGYIGLAETYGLDFGDVRGMEHGLAYAAIASGKADVVDTWTTDGKLRDYNMKLLEDDLGFFPPYDCAPVIRGAVLKRHPELRDVIESLAFKISQDLMMEMNHLVEVEDRRFHEVAALLLERCGFAGEALTESKPRGSFLGFLWERRAELGALTVEHIILTGLAVILAILAAVPLGILLTRTERIATPVLTATGVIQTVPSIALLAFFIPVLGLGTPAALAALFLYALLPIVRNTYTGIRGIEPSLIEAARGIGMSDGQILRLVELPLATRTIMAGVRTATVINVGVATLAAFIGAGGLGDPIVTGLQLDDTWTVLSGALPAAALAIVLDLLLGRLETRLAHR